MTITVNGSTNTITAASGLTIAGVTGVSDTTEATSTTAASLKTAGGLAVAKKTYCGDNIVMASGKGIDFSATANSSGTTTSEVLSDYEEGSFTPTIEGTTSAGVGTYSDRTGGYTRAGRLVTFYCTLAWSAHTGTGDLKLTGLPFTCNSSQRGSCTVESAGLTATNPLGRVEITTSHITFVEMVSATRVALDTSVTYVFLAGHYYV